MTSISMSSALFTGFFKSMMAMVRPEMQCRYAEEVNIVRHLLPYMVGGASGW